MELAEILMTEPGRVEALPALTAPLLAWYDRAARSLPWRDEPTPYRVWVSEIMLQQTRVEAARGYFERFVAALPDIAALARCPEEELLKLWEGLGYYSRARNLQKAARVVMEQHDGRLPADYEALRALPGIGEYTAGAIASIAFGIAMPAPDGNVYRVLSRLLCSYAEPSSQRVKRAYAAAAARLLSEQRPGDLNQALMELGATVCLPGGAPQCLLCPVAGPCAAREAGCAHELPVRPRKKERRQETRCIVLLIADGRVLLQRRPDKGLLAGMYQPVNLEEQGEAALREALRVLGAGEVTLRELGTSTHLFSHVRWDMRGWAVHCAPFAAPDGWVWADERLLRESCALPSAFAAYTRRLPELLAENGAGEG